MRSHASPVIALALGLGLMLGGQATAGSNLVANPGFETGSFSDWTVSGTISTMPKYTYVTDVTYAYGPHSGSYYALIGAESTDPLTLSQTISTIAGDQYTFSWYLASDSSEENQFTATWNGSTVSSQSDIGVQGYTLYSFTETATSSSTTIAFSIYNNPGYFYLDDVSVTQNPISLFAVPEPSSLVLGGLGAIAVIAVSRRARRRIAR